MYALNCVPNLCGPVHVCLHCPPSVVVSWRGSDYLRFSQPIEGAIALPDPTINSHVNLIQRSSVSTNRPSQRTEKVDAAYQGCCLSFSRSLSLRRVLLLCATKTTTPSSPSHNSLQVSVARMCVKYPEVRLCGCPFVTWAPCHHHRLVGGRCASPTWSDRAVHVNICCHRLCEGCPLGRLDCEESDWIRRRDSGEAIQHNPAYHIFYRELVEARQRHRRCNQELWLPLVHFTV